LITTKIIKDNNKLYEGGVMKTLPKMFLVYCWCFCLVALGLADNTSTKVNKEQSNELRIQQELDAKTADKSNSLTKEKEEQAIDEALTPKLAPLRSKPSTSSEFEKAEKPIVLSFEEAKRNEQLAAKAAATQLVHVDADANLQIININTDSRDTVVGTVSASYDSWPSESDWFIGVYADPADPTALYYACYATDDTGACVSSGWVGVGSQNPGFDMSFDTAYTYAIVTYDQYADGGVVVTVSGPDGTEWVSAAASSDYTYAYATTNFDIPAVATVCSDITFTLSDYYSDGFEAELTFDGNSMSGNTGDSFTYCLEDGTYSYTYSCFSYCGEHSWTVTDADGNVLSSGQGDYNGDQTLSFNVGGPAPVPGCTDDTACNYDADATADDGSCTYATDTVDCSGTCIDETACNANEVADCVYAADGYDCDGNWTEDYYLISMGGSTDASGTLYDDGGPNANYSNSSDYTFTIDIGDAGNVQLDFTEFNFESGWDYLYVACGDAESATAYSGTSSPGLILCGSSSATVRQDADGSVNRSGFAMAWSAAAADTVLGCTDETAENYNPDANTDDGTCLFLGDACAYPTTDGVSLLDTYYGVGTWTQTCAPSDAGGTITWDYDQFQSYVYLFGWTDCDATNVLGAGLTGYSTVYSPEYTLGAGECLTWMAQDYYGYLNGSITVTAVFTQATACEDETACNTGAIEDCTYPADGYDCDGNWTEDYYLVSMGGSTDAEGTLYDDGGPNASYSNSSDYTFTIDIGDAGNVQLNFIEFDFENNYDLLYVACGDGDATAYTGSAGPGVVVCDSSSATVRQDCDSSVSYSGFMMEWSAAAASDVLGCTDETALNYDSDATLDDGSCSYAGDDCSTAIAVEGASASGVLESGGAVWHSVELGDGLAYATFSLCGSTFDSKIEVWSACDADSYLAYNDDNSAACAEYDEDGNYVSGSGLRSEASLDAPAAGTYFVKVYGYGSAAGDYELAISSETIVYGCTDSYANNYNPDANTDDGTCDYSCAENAITVVMGDNYGDGWNGGSLTIGDTVLTGPAIGCESDCDNIYDSCYGGGDNTYCVETVELCLADGTYDVTVGGSSYGGEMSWSISDENGVIFEASAPNAGSFSGSMVLPVPEYVCGDGVCNDASYTDNDGMPGTEYCGPADSDACFQDCGACPWEDQDAPVLSSYGTYHTDEDEVVYPAVQWSWTALSEGFTCEDIIADPSLDACYTYSIGGGYTCDDLSGYGYDCSLTEACGLCWVPDACSDAGGNSYWAGDGMCDSANNNEACGYDGGDCCCSTCDTTDFENYDAWECGLVNDSSAGYDCQDPSVDTEAGSADCDCLAADDIVGNDCGAVVALDAA